MFSMITNIYNKKTKGPTLMEFFTATEKLKKFFFWQLQLFDVCTMGDAPHINTIFKFLPHTHQQSWISYRCVPCHPWCTHRTSLVVEKKLFQFSCGCEKFHYGRSSSFLVINICNHGEHYETPCISIYFSFAELQVLILSDLMSQKSHAFSCV